MFMQTPTRPFFAPYFLERVPLEDHPSGRKWFESPPICLGHGVVWPFGRGPTNPELGTSDHHAY